MRLVTTSVDLLNPEERQAKRHLFTEVRFVTGSLEFKGHAQAGSFPTLLLNQM